MVVDRTTTDRRTITDRALTAADPTGIIAGQVSPDGEHAAYIQIPTTGGIRARLHLVDLNTGADHTLPINLNPYTLRGSLYGFSADGYYLAAVTAAGQTDIIDTATLAVRTLPTSVPPLLGLTTRITPSP